MRTAATARQIVHSVCPMISEYFARGRWQAESFRRLRMRRPGRWRPRREERIPTHLWKWGVTPASQDGAPASGRSSRLRQLRRCILQKPSIGRNHIFRDQSLRQGFWMRILKKNPVRRSRTWWLGRSWSLVRTTPLGALSKVRLARQRCG